MINNYFYDQDGDAQSSEIKREKAVSAVLEIIHAAAVNTGVQLSLRHIQSELSDAADALQAALENRNQ